MRWLQLVATYEPCELTDGEAIVGVDALLEEADALLMHFQYTEVVWRVQNLGHIVIVDP